MKRLETFNENGERIMKRNDEVTRGNNIMDDKKKEKKEEQRV